MYGGQISMPGRLVAAGSNKHPMLSKRCEGIVTVLQESRLQLFLDAAKIFQFKILWDLRPRLNADAFDSPWRGAVGGRGTE